MKKFLPCISLLLLLSACWAGDDAAQPPSPASAPAGDTAEADALLKAYRAVPLPAMDMTHKNDAAYEQQRRAADLKRAEIALEFSRKFPNHPLADSMLQQRWLLLADAGQPEKAFDEIDKALAAHPGDPAVLYARAKVLLASSRTEPAKAKAAIDQFIQAHPQDPRGTDLIMELANRAPDKSQRLAALERLVQLYPDSKAAAMAEGQIHQANGLGKPFELSFSDAVSGKPISIQSLKGKVVVIDFWATWCGPCVAEMPNMKKLYAEYKDKGVEFIGVSLDQPEEKGGLERLKKYVADKQIPWPQYYQGKGWDSDFSKSWGVNGIPCVFIIDADGNLASTQARGKLETLIPELLARRGESRTAG